MNEEVISKSSVLNSLQELKKRTDPILWPHVLLIELYITQNSIESSRREIKSLMERIEWHRSKRTQLEKIICELNKTIKEDS